MPQQEALERARNRAEAKMRFYVHLGVYLAVGALLVVINLRAMPGPLWVVWPLLGWGLAVVLHALRVFVIPERSPVMERMIQRELEREP